MAKGDKKKKKAKGKGSAKNRVEALKADPHLANGLTVSAGRVTYEAVARDLGVSVGPGRGSAAGSAGTSAGALRRRRSTSTQAAQQKRRPFSPSIGSFPVLWT